LDSFRLIFTILITAFTTVFIAGLLGFLMGIKGVILGIILVPILTLSYYYPYWGLLGFLIYLPFSGTITYSIAGVFTPERDGVIFDPLSYAFFHLAKDIFYYPALLAILLISHHWKSLFFQYRVWFFAIAILLICCFITVASETINSSGQYLVINLIGLKVLFGYIPWLLCGFYLSKDRRCLLWFFRLWVVLIILCCGLALVQYGLLATGICAGNTDLPGPLALRPNLQAHCFVGGSLLYNPSKGFLRLPGTFVAPWQWAWFLIASCFITYGARLIEPISRWRSLHLLAQAMVLGATLVSGQMTALLLVPIGFLLQLLMVEKRKRWLGAKLGVVSLISLILVTQFGLVQDRLQSLASRWEYSSPPGFVLRQIIWVVGHNFTFFGNGLGTTSSAARRLINIRLIESFPALIFYEIGLLGFLAYYFVLIITLFITWKSYRLIKEPKIAQLGLCLWMFLVLISFNPYYYPLMVDPVSVYYWLTAGILLKLPYLEQLPLTQSWTIPQAWRQGYAALDKIYYKSDKEVDWGLFEKFNGQKSKRIG
jgi:hypothetical protein